MTQEKHYTVMELAERIGVPRTTINDWLSRYAPYMEFTMQGKRRIYSENTLAVLQRISQLRASGASSFQIDGELAASYAVHPETADEPAPPPSGEPASPKSAEVPPSEPAPAGETTPVPEEESSGAVSQETALVRNPSEDPAVLLGERFREMLEKMDSLEKRSRSGAVRAWFFFAFAAILLLLLGIAGIFVHQLLRDMEDEARVKNAELAQLTDHAASLTAGAQSMREQLETLQNGLAAQEKEFRAALKENKANYEKRREAELAAQKDRFAAERLELVRQMETERNEAQAREARWKKEGEEALQRLKQEQETALKKQAETLKAEAEKEKARILREKEAELDRMKKETEKLPSVTASATASEPPAVPVPEKKSEAGVGGAGH